MSSSTHRLKRSRRISEQKRSIRRQVRIAKTNGQTVDEPHRFAKLNAMDCGHPNCWMCSGGGHRERTIQELRSFDEMEIYYE